MLNESDKRQGKIHLTKTLCHMQRMNAVEMAKETQSIASTVNNNEAEVDNDLDSIELLLMEREIPLSFRPRDGAKTFYPEMKSFLFMMSINY